MSVDSTVTSRISVCEAHAALSRFQELTTVHKGLHARLQVLGIFMTVMNSEKFGIESCALCTFRRLRDNRESNKWDS